MEGASCVSALHAVRFLANFCLRTLTRALTAYKQMTLKLADFGLCLSLREERSVTRAGTLVRAQLSPLTLFAALRGLSLQQQGDL